MADSEFSRSPQPYVRIGGALYLIIIALGLFAEGGVTNTLIVAGDAAATARNIIESQPLWRLGVAVNLIVPICAVPLLAIEYLLLRPVSKPLVLLAVLFNVVSLALEAVSKIHLLEVTALLGGDSSYASAFGPQQLHALAHLSLQSHDAAWNLALIFFGFTCVINGILIFKSGYLPKAVGVLMQLAGLSYLTACLSVFFAPAFADHILPAVLLPAFIGESSLCLWLLVKGVDLNKWHARRASISARVGVPA
jgi:hypothetical protein